MEEPQLHFQTPPPPEKHEAEPLGFIASDQITKPRVLRALLAREERRRRRRGSEDDSAEPEDAAGVPVHQEPGGHRAGAVREEAPHPAGARGGQAHPHRAPQRGARAAEADRPRGPAVSDLLEKEN